MALPKGKAGARFCRQGEREIAEKRADSPV
jgi:hypothetical protein